MDPRAPTVPPVAGEERVVHTAHPRKARCGIPPRVRHCISDGPMLSRVAISFADFQGSGKSVLAKSILESQIESYQPKGGENIKTQHQHQHPHSETLYYFCNNRKRGKDETGGSILRALIHQFAKSWPRLVDSVLEGHAATDSHGFLHDVAFEWSLKRLWEIFKTLVGESCLDKVFVVIDALDECERTSTEDLLFMLPDIMQSEEKTPEIKILLTSRTEDHIEEALLDQALSLPLRPELLEGDMVTYVWVLFHSRVSPKRVLIRE